MMGTCWIDHDGKGINWFNHDTDHDGVNLGTHQVGVGTDQPFISDGAKTGRGGEVCRCVSNDNESLWSQNTILESFFF